MKLANYIVRFISICLIPGILSGQADSLVIDQEIKVLNDSLTQFELQDTMSMAKTDTLVPDNKKVERETITFSKDSLDFPITYGAIDTQWYEHKTKQMHLYGNAYVNYQEMELKAGYIVLNIDRKIAEAKYIKTGNKEKDQIPIFNDGNKQVTYEHLKYNFKTKKGIVYEAVSTEGDLFLHGERTKFVGINEEEGQDEDVVYNKNTLITTCTHEHPHFGFRTRKLKLIPQKLAVIGPANLEVGGVPTPFWIPYGFFPLVSGKSTGFIFPDDYEYSPNLGFGLRGFGWYFPINDYLDVTLKADLYTRGTHGLTVNSNYNKKYKYRGNIFLAYNNQLIENNESISKISNKRFAINLKHFQAAKAHPYIEIGGDINFESGNYGRSVLNDANSVLTNTYSSNFNFSHSLPTLPWRFSIGLRHSQNTNNRQVNITLPDVTFLMNRINPFKRKDRGGDDERWYERIVYKYDVKIKNLIETTDTTLFTQEVLNNMKSGVSHDMESSLSFKVLKHFSLNTRVEYDELWLLQEEERTEGSESVVDFYDIDPETGDTLQTFFRDSLFVNENVFNEFNAFRTYRASVDLNTQIFGTAQFAKGWLRGIRHTLKPSIGFTVSPDSESGIRDTLYTDAVSSGIVAYSRLPRQPFSPRTGSQQMALTYNFTNLLEMKYFSKKDSTEKKFKPLDRLTFGGNYNFVSDSLNWSKATLNGDSRFFKGVTVLSYRAEWDPYLEKGRGTRLAQTVWSENKRIARLDYARVKLTNRFGVKKLIELFSKNKKESEEQKEQDSSSIPNQDPLSSDRDGELKPTKSSDEKNKKSLKEVGLFEWLDRINFVHDLQWEYITEDNIGRSEISIHSLGMSGSIDLTENWSFTIGNIGYDFVRKGLNYPTFRFSRKLHCWNMTMSWQPNRDTYGFFIGVTSGSMDFLKYNYGRNNIDSGFRPF